MILNTLNEFYNISLIINDHIDILFEMLCIFFTILNNVTN
jgi:hypothetical protein